MGTKFMIGVVIVCVCALVVAIIFSTLANQHRELTQTHIDAQSQTIIQMLETKGYSVNSAYFNSPSVTVITDSFDALVEKAKLIGTTNIYRISEIIEVEGWSYKGVAFYVIDSQAAYAFKYTPTYTP